MQRLYPTAAQLDSDEAVEEEYVRPAGRHVRANFVTSIDAAVEIGGRSSPLGGPADRQAFMAMRAVADVILVGAGTVRGENYGPIRLEPPAKDRRRARSQTALPRLAIVSNRADLDAGARVWGGDDKPLLITTAAAADARRDLGAVAETVVCGDQWVEVGLAMAELSARGLERVLCEGGPTLFHSLLTAGLIDELCVTTAPCLVGAGHRGLLGQQPLDEPASLRLSSLLEGDGMLLARYGCGPRQ